MKNPIKPSWHPDAACMPFCSDNCPSRYVEDAEFNYETGQYWFPQWGCKALEDMPPDCPEFCEECEVCLPALYLGLAKGESR